ncbi:MAG: hypothetical protein H7A25_19435 [Leptospiraceae bacterium]|nr:hypothetical protein [Leptospiraceae bacterium]
MVKKLLSSSVAALFAATLFVSPVSAKGDCRGLDESKCKADNACNWVGASKRKGKNGKDINVKAHCRGKGGGPRVRKDDDKKGPRGGDRKGPRGNRGGDKKAPVKKDGGDRKGPRGKKDADKK